MMNPARHMSLLGRFSGSAMQAIRAVPDGAQRSSAMHAFSVQAAAAEPAEPEKKPNSAYINFVSDNYKSVKAKNPTSQSKDVMTLLGAEWKKLGGAAKDKYKAEAAKAKEAYELKYPPGSQPKRTPKTKKAKAAAAGGDADGEEKKPKAKRAPSAYNIYVQERMPAFKKPGETSANVMSLIGKEWKTLSQAEKDQWKVKAAERAAKAS